MDKNKDQIIQDIIDATEKSKIANLKKSVIQNADSDKISGLMLYNSMLDNIAFGPHTITTINYAGIDWKMRLLGSEEWDEIRVSVSKQIEVEKVFENFHTEFLLIRRILARALTPNPFKTEESPTVWSEKDLGFIPLHILEQLYKRYIHFVDQCQTDPTEITNEEFEDLLKLVKKNTEILSGLDRPRLLAVTKYLLPYSLSLEKMLNSDTDSKSS